MAKAMTVPASEKEWQARHDLDTLIEAEKIKRDVKRLKAALAKKRELKKALDGVAEK